MPKNRQACLKAYKEVGRTMQEAARKPSIALTIKLTKAESKRLDEAVKKFSDVHWRTTRESFIRMAMERLEAQVELQ